MGKESNLVQLDPVRFSQLNQSLQRVSLLKRFPSRNGASLRSSIEHRNFLSRVIHASPAKLCPLSFPNTFPPLSISYSSRVSIGGAIKRWKQFSIGPRKIGTTSNFRSPTANFLLFHENTPGGKFPRVDKSSIRDMKLRYPEYSSFNSHSN